MRKTAVDETLQRAFLEAPGTSAPGWSARRRRSAVVPVSQSQRAASAAGAASTRRWHLRTIGGEATVGKRATPTIGTGLRIMAHRPVSQWRPGKQTLLHPNRLLLPAPRCRVRSLSMRTRQALILICWHRHRRRWVLRLLRLLWPPRSKGVTRAIRWVVAPSVERVQFLRRPARRRKSVPRRLKPDFPSRFIKLALHRGPLPLQVRYLAPRPIARLTRSAVDVLVALSPGVVSDPIQVKHLLRLLRHQAKRVGGGQRHLSIIRSSTRRP